MSRLRVKSNTRSCYIYKTTCLIDGFIYVGQRTCWWSPYADTWYKGSGTVLQRKMRKYGRENFQKEIIEVLDSFDQQKLDKREIYWVAYYDTNNPNVGYNLTKGGATGSTIANHPDKKHILEKRVSSWRENYSKDEKRQQKRKKQLDQARLKRYKGACFRKRRKRVVELDIATNEILHIYPTLTIAQNYNKLQAISGAIKRGGLCGGKYFQFENKEGKYKKFEPIPVWNKGKKFPGKVTSTSWKKGQKAVNPTPKGTHNSPRTEWKKGHIPWNKGIEYLQIRGKNHPHSKAVIQFDLNYNQVGYFETCTDAVKAKFYRTRLSRALKKKFGIYKGYRWAYEKDCDFIESMEIIEELPDYVYNLEIEDNHNYFVNGILTHNCDDPMDPQMATSEKERENAKNFYNHTLSSRLNDPDVGVRIVVMQRLHQDDTSGLLMDKKKGRPDQHTHICIPGELDREVLSPPELEKYYTDGLFWPSRFSKQTLEGFKKMLGSLQYAGQVGQRPAPPEGNLVKREWFEIKKANLIVRDSNKSPVFFFLDTAYTEKQENDPSAILACFHHDNKIYILNTAEVYMIFPDLIEFVKSYVAINDYSNMGSMIYVEPKASGKSLVQSLRVSSRLNVGEIESDLVNGRDKLGRLSTVSPYIQSGRVVLVEGQWNEAFLSQVCSFPNAAHDEMVDLLCYAVDTLLINNQGDLIGIM